ncbi:MAG: autotransporter-associated beta strand repeat-containing protein [Kiritimatiellaeota bacterium]|nr:autotransporter-associated beta strand repeat-containing protein [Kiritimatiellota bacterium]
MPIAPSAPIDLRDGTALILDGVDQSIAALSGTGEINLGPGTTLTLSPAATSTFYGPITGDGSLTKTGPGTQRLHGQNTFTGNLTVREGTLETAPPAPYTWFRFTVKRKFGDTPVMQLSELALCSADNTRRDLGLRWAPTRTTTRLNPGECSTPAAHYPNWNFEGADLLFDNDVGSKFCTTWRTPMPDDPDSWLIVLMRLPDDTPQITQYNMATANDSGQYAERSPTHWTLEASPDGTTWFLVDERTNVTPPDANYTWYNGSFYYTLSTAPAAPAPAPGSIPPAALVEIRDGATLSVGHPAEQIAALAIDLTHGAGTLTLLNPAVGGDLYLTNAPDNPSGLLPLTVEALGGGALGSWTVHVNGAPRAGLRVTYSPADTALRLTKGGTILMLK